MSPQRKNGELCEALHRLEAQHTPGAVQHLADVIGDDPKLLRHYLCTVRHNAATPEEVEPYEQKCRDMESTAKAA